MKCKVEGCEQDVKYIGLCGMHYKRQWRHGDVLTTLTPTRGQPKEVCSVADCDEIVDSKGMCKVHYLRYKRHGRTHKVHVRRDKFKDTNGYIRLRTGDNSWIYEHIYLAQKALGKPLPPKAVVHHTGKKDDNYGFFKLVVCPNQGYHKLIHRRAKELGYENN